MRQSYPKMSPDLATAIDMYGEGDEVCPQMMHASPLESVREAGGPDALRVYRISGCLLFVEIWPCPHTLGIGKEKGLGFETKMM